MRLSAEGSSPLPGVGKPSTANSWGPQNPVKGRKFMAAADCTPGIARKFATDRSTKARSFSGSLAG